MAINLSKGQKINLVKETGDKLTEFCVGVNWGAIIKEEKSFMGLMNKKVVEEVDLDLSCIMTSQEGELLDWIYSPLFNTFLAKNKYPLGKLESFDKAFKHTGDDTEGDTDGDDGLDNEIIIVNLKRVSEKISKIFFFLNIYMGDGKNYDFSQIPYAKIRMYEGTEEYVRKVYANYDIVTDNNFVGKRAIILGKLYKRNDEWKFDAIGDPTEDQIFIETISRILNHYAK